MFTLERHDLFHIDLVQKRPVVSFDVVFLDRGPDSTVILAGVGRGLAQNPPSVSLLGSLPSQLSLGNKGGADPSLWTRMAEGAFSAPPTPQI